MIVLTTTFPARAGDGTPEFVLTLARSLPDAAVTVVAPRMPGGARTERIDGVDVRRVAYFPRRWEGVAHGAIMPTLRAQWWRLVEVPFLVGALTVATLRAVRGRRHVVLNPHWILPSGLVALVVGRLARVPYVLTVHGADAYTLRGPVLGRLKRLVLRHAAAVLPVSGDIARSLGVEEASVLRMGVDTLAVRRAVGRRIPQPGLLVFVGRLADKKGVDVLIRAVARLPEARVEVVGDGPERAGLEALARHLGVADRMTFRGTVPRQGVLAALARAQAVVIPSRVGAGGDTDGTPVVLAEAMAAGVPVVASDLGGLGECIEHGRTGVLVPPDDVEALAAALGSVLDGSVDLDGLARAAGAEAARSLDAGHLGAAYRRVLGEVLP